jgi:hypothetical protein
MSRARIYERGLWLATLKISLEETPDLPNGPYADKENDTVFVAHITHDKTIGDALQLVKVFVSNVRHHRLSLLVDPPSSSMLPQNYKSMRMHV